MDKSRRQRVILDDIAQAYDVRGSRDVASGTQSQEQHYKQFMSLWGVMPYRDQVVTFDVFVDLFANVSAGYGSDAQFI